MDQRRISFVTSSMNEPGSGNSLLALMANHWAGAGHQVSLLTFAGTDTPAYELDPAIRVHPLDLFASSISFFGAVRDFVLRLSALRRAIRAQNPDVLVCVLEDPAIRVLLAALGLNIPVVVVSHTDTMMFDLPRGWNALRRLTFPLACTVVVLTEKIRSRLPSSVARKAMVIPNPVVLPPTTPEGLQTDGPMAVSVGRMIELKRHDMLMRAFASIAQEVPEWKLAIVGDGPELEALVSLRAELGLDERVLLPGFSQSVGDWYDRAELFVFSSRHEGFPLVLVEAMAHGLPVVTTDYPSGPEAIVRNGEDGLIVPVNSESELAAAMLSLMVDEGRRKGMSEKAREVRERFSIEAILERWDELLRRVSG